MVNYCKADLMRLFTSIPRLILVAVSYLVIGIILAVQYVQKANTYDFSSAIQIYLQYFIPTLLGAIELSYVYTEDFRAKTMQVAIGIGIPRPLVVLTKLVDLVLATLVDLIGFGAVTFLGAVLLHGGLNGEQYGDLLIFLFVTLMRITCFAALAMIPMFFTQNEGLGMLFYLATAVPILPALLTTLLQAGPLMQYRLDHFIITNQLDQLGAYLLTGTPHAGNILGIVAYLVLCYLATVLLFQKRELEF